MDDEDNGRARSNGLATSSDGVTVVSLNKSKTTATLRPIPALDVDGPARGWLSEEMEDEEDEDLRFRGLADLDGEMVNTASDADIREDGRV